MNSRRTASTFFGVGFFTALVLTSDAFAATATLSDVTDFITRLGGYLFPVKGLPDNNYYYWLQVSYTLTTSGGGSTTSGGTSTTSGGGQNASGGGSNITKIVMTKFPTAAVRRVTGTGATPIVLPVNNASIANQLYACAAENYTVETVTLDLRDIELITPAPAQETILDEDGKPMLDPGGKPIPIWSVVLQTTNSKTNFIRINTQTLPANCPVGGAKIDAKMEQKDLPKYSIYFADLNQANRFVQLLNNVIPTLNPPVLLGPTAPQ